MHSWQPGFSQKKVLLVVGVIAFIVGSAEGYLLGTPTTQPILSILHQLQPPASIRLQQANSIVPPPTSIPKPTLIECMTLPPMELGC